MMSSFYKKRWEMYFEFLSDQMKGGASQAPDFFAWERAWVSRQEEAMAGVGLEGLASNGREGLVGSRPEGPAASGPKGPAGDKSLIPLVNTILSRL